MWKLWQTAQQSHSRPSDLLTVPDRLDAYLLDRAVTTFGLIMENALQERVNRGSDSHPKWEPKYSLEMLLEPHFRLPRVPRKGKPLLGGIQTILALAGQHGSGVKKWAYVPPTDGMKPA